MANKWAYQKALKFLNDMPSNFPHAVYVAEALYAAAEEVVRVAYREADDALDISECMSLSVFVQRVLDKLGR